MENQPTETSDAVGAQFPAVLREGTRRLEASGIDNATLDAEVLFGHALNLTREQMLLLAGRAISAVQLHAYKRLLARRCDHEPVAYITGRREFWSLDIHVTPAVLIPRPETEHLVEVALELAVQLNSVQPLRIVDIGTGSGAIAVALARELASAEVFATDISAAALAVAAENAARNYVARKIKFIHGDLFSGLPMAQQIDILVSNPPYIRRADIDELDPEVSRWEPRGALDGGLDGLDYFRRIAAQAFRYLRPNGAVAVEIGAGMAAAVAALFRASAGCAKIEIHKDYAGKERIVVARKSSFESGSGKRSSG